ncbi:methyltransferase [Candidatus Bathyarchaeota archaeon]|nr:methyltransferase [Candidatus Bathyarchaeota archaeon]
MEKGLIKTFIRGREYTFLTASGLFSYKRIDNGTRLLVESMVIPQKGLFLDMGCGIGVIGLVAARENPELNVVMIDINPRAVMIASENVERMGLENVEVLEGFLYEPVEGRIFNTIVSNPPVSAGMSRIVEPLVKNASKHLASEGSIQLVIQSQKGGNTLAEYMTEAFGEYKILARSGGYRVLISTTN